MNEHPVCLRHQLGDVAALKLSDFVSRRQLHNSRLYELWFKPEGVEYELNVPIPSPLWHTKTFLFDRTGRRDFTERDRLVLDRLQPHLARLWQAARTRRLLAAALAGLEHAAETDSQGVILLGSDGEIEFASAPARRLLGGVFPGRAERAPPARARRVARSGSERAVRPSVRPSSAEHRAVGRRAPARSAAGGGSADPSGG
jgi:PAS domain-containing protein